MKFYMLQLGAQSLAATTLQSRQWHVREMYSADPKKRGRIKHSPTSA